MSIFCETIKHKHIKDIVSIRNKKLFHTPFPKNNKHKKLHINIEQNIQLRFNIASLFVET